MHTRRTALSHHTKSSLEHRRKHAESKHAESCTKQEALYKTTDANCGRRRFRWPDKLLPIHRLRNINTIDDSKNATNSEPFQDPIYIRDMYMYQMHFFAAHLPSVSLPAESFLAPSAAWHAAGGRLYTRRKFGSRPGPAARALGVQSRASWQVSITRYIVPVYNTLYTGLGLAKYSILYTIYNIQQCLVYTVWSI